VKNDPNSLKVSTKNGTIVAAIVAFLLQAEIAMLKDIADRAASSAIEGLKEREMDDQNECRVNTNV